MKFTKMHGNGNDYIYVDCFKESVAEDEAPEISRRVSNRRFGVGSDGLVLIRPSVAADCRMDMYNADGAQGRMCGNALRCVGKYAHDRGLVNKPVITVETLAGIKTLELTLKDGICVGARANMGEPDFSPAIIPMAACIKEEFVNQPVTAGDRQIYGTSLSTGPSHFVTFVDDPDAVDVEKYGKLIENHALFPDRVNVNFAQVVSDDYIKSRTWERGSGETWACGSGACAVLVVAALLGKAKRKGTVRQIGGELDILWDEETNFIYMTGPAEFVCDGVFPVY